ncbi:MULTISPECIES: SURF1 family protein [unclassified Luteimonas]|uniref:SURF1 family protein n=1 Tax=unclassified Luteimonas TaxID=2629088 RepID=UPI0018F0BFFF|nr:MULTISPECIES: SURF1 family protein [unclassified Luteimonas]MBJ6979889.1 SURF1 family protein [Luteimonas sp. MC1895]MBJ6985600.1 SURF1 family protein [Luteimonas sp. MC1750]QQO06086.1 SURF1 family protein [Luteimonas sp. MC1750]
MSRGVTMVVGWMVALLAIAAFSSLGHWQLGRQQEKQRMLDQVATTVSARTPLPLAAATDPVRTRGYDWSAGTGHFAEAPAVLLDNQQRNGRAGVRVYRAFVPDAGSGPLLVELGWLPLPPDRTLPAVPRPTGARQVAGLLVPPPSHGIGPAGFAAQADGTLLAIGLDPATLAAPLQQPALAPRVLKLDPDLDIGYARDLDVLPNTLPPERHLGYAVQWFALALAVLVTALILTYRRQRP